MTTSTTPTVAPTTQVEKTQQVQDLETREYVKVTETEAFERVHAAVAKARSIHFDGCHKIYLSMDRRVTERFIENEYEFVKPSAERVEDWFFSSCGLRFIQAVFPNTDGKDPNGGYVDLIPQGSNWDEDEDDE